MLDKSNSTDKNEFINFLMTKMDSGNEAIIRTTKGDIYGRIVSVGLDKVTIEQEGKLKEISPDYILEVE